MWLVLFLSLISDFDACKNLAATIARAADPQTLSQKSDEEVKKELNEALATIEAARGDAWRILGLNREANVDDLKRVYRQLSKLYHPDRWNNRGPEISDLANKISREINAANERVKYELENGTPSFSREPETRDPTKIQNELREKLNLIPIEALRVAEICTRVEYLVLPGKYYPFQQAEREHFIKSNRDRLLKKASTFTDYISLLRTFDWSALDERLLIEGARRKIKSEREFLELYFFLQRFRPAIEPFQKITAEQDIEQIAKAKQIGRKEVARSILAQISAEARDFGEWSIPHQNIAELLLRPLIKDPTTEDLYAMKHAILDLDSRKIAKENFPDIFRYGLKKMLEFKPALRADAIRIFGIPFLRENVEGFKPSLMERFFSGRSELQKEKDKLSADAKDLEALERKYGENALQAARKVMEGSRITDDIKSTGKDPKLLTERLARAAALLAKSPIIIEKGKDLETKLKALYWASKASTPNARDTILLAARFSSDEVSLVVADVLPSLLQDP